jgi:hypothetical protein
MHVYTPVGTLTTVMQVEYTRKIRDRQTDMDGPLRCSLLTLEREEHIIIGNNHCLHGVYGDYC